MADQNVEVNEEAEGNLSPISRASNSPWFECQQGLIPEPQLHHDQDEVSASDPLPSKLDSENIEVMH